MKLLEVRNLNVTYRTGYKNSLALKDVNFDIFAGEYVCLVGDNGTGKSTLIKSILGLIENYSGIISVKCLKNQVSYVPQSSTIPLDFPATVDEIVLSGMQRAGTYLPFYKKDDKIAAENAIENVSLKKFMKRRICELSGGQRQRVLLARALCKAPKLLILDEPCSGLDEKTSDEFYGILDRLNKENNTTIIMVSHDLLRVKKYATRIIKLENKIVFDGKVAAFS